MPVGIDKCFLADKKDVFLLAYFDAYYNF